MMNMESSVPIGIAQNTLVDVNAIAFRDELRVPDTYIIIYDQMN